MGCDVCPLRVTRYDPFRRSLEVASAAKEGAQGRFESRVQVGCTRLLQCGRFQRWGGGGLSHEPGYVDTEIAMGCYPLLESVPTYPTLQRFRLPQKTQGGSIKHVSHAEDSCGRSTPREGSHRPQLCTCNRPGPAWRSPSPATLLALLVVS